MLLVFISISFLAGLAAYYYNRLIRASQLVKEAESGIDVHLKRRHDLIPNLVEVVKGYVAHERKLLEDVTRLRGQAAEERGLNDRRAAAENQLTAGLRTVFALAESYPDLKADSQFINLHNNLVHTEEELQMARRYYNGTVRDMNVLVQSFPSNLVAGIFHFSSGAYFEVETVAERARPDVRL